MQGWTYVLTDHTSVVDLQELALAQVDNPNLSRFCADSSLRFESAPFLSEGISLVCDISTGIQHP